MKDCFSDKMLGKENIENAHMSKILESSEHLLNKTT